MRVLVACENSGRVRDAFNAMGHDATSCDLLPSKTPGPHYTGDVFHILGDAWDLLIAHPPCTFLARSGIHRNTGDAARQRATREAIEFTQRLWQAKHIKRRCIENPIGALSAVIGKPQQVIQPWMFGDDASKATCLWLHELPELQGITNPVPPRLVLDRGVWAMRWANQSDNGQNNVSTRAGRAQLRSITYPGVARAMARQWST